MAKFAVGTKVRIRAGRMGRQGFSDIWRYENLTGEVVSSTPVVGYVVRYWTVDVSGPAEPLQAYRVRLQEGTELLDLLEDCLEAIETS